jgi:hypothetical protein
VSNGEKVFVERVKGYTPGFSESITYQENEDRFIKEDMFVEDISVKEFKKKLDEIYRSTEYLVNKKRFTTTSRILFSII